METVAIEHLNFSYPGQASPVLRDISLTIPKGQFVTLCGPSGCGKTTLLRQLKTVLAPHGARSGVVSVDGRPLEELDARTQSEKIGFVLQSPENQIVTDKVWHELAFGLESLGYDTPTIRLRVAEMASFFGIQTWFYKDVSQLSGGQKQLLNLAGVMAMQPSLLILDEPTSQLDPIAAADFLATVGKINRELGVTVLLTEHRLEEALPLSDRCIVMDNGAVLADGAPKEVGHRLRELDHNMFLAMPTPMRVWAGVENDQVCPVTVREGRNWLDQVAEERPLTPTPTESVDGLNTPPFAVELKGAWFRYDKEAPDIVKGLSMSVPYGQFCAIVGGNGTGKTTALSLISGSRKPFRGTVRVAGRPLSEIPDAEKFGGLLGVLPQNPQALFVKKTVELDLYEMVADRDLSPQAQADRVGRVARLCALEGLLDRHPYDLSGGEQQRAALAKVLLLEPKILLLDEPTKGMDSYFKAQFAQVLQGLLAQGVTILMVSHDVEFCARYADRCAMFFDGAVVSDGAPQSFFSGNSFYTTAANRMARHILPLAVTLEQVIAACGGAMPQPEPTPPTRAPSPPPEKKVQAPVSGETPLRKRRLGGRTLMSALMVLLLIPLTLYVGLVHMGSQKYYFIALLIVFETMVPFFMIFEGRKPQARELVVIAVLCALGVAGRAAFFMLPHVKPVTALVIIAAVAFGGESGFLVGAVSMFVSNFFFGQGPWTPWQMFAMGLIGFLAGVLFRRGFLARDRMAMALYGFLSVMIIYGGLMNPTMILLGQGAVTWPAIAGAYIMGIPMDLVHAGSTAAFLWLAAPAMLEKLDRIKEKYGLIS